MNHLVPNPSRNTSTAGEEQLAIRSRTLAAQKRRPELDRSYIIPVLGKALTIIQLLQSSRSAMNVNQVCLATGYPRSTVYRILRTLAAHGFIPLGDEGVYSFKHISAKDAPAGGRSRLRQ